MAAPTVNEPAALQVGGGLAHCLYYRGSMHVWEHDGVSHMKAALGKQ
jgi:hypothetical protein